MKLAEALILRSDMQKRIEQVKSRINNNTKVQEGESPSEDPLELIKEIEELLKNLESIVQKINQTNSATSFNQDMTLADALAKRDILGLHREILHDAVESASIKHDRYSRSEVKYYSTIDVKKVQKSVDQLSKDYRELDTKIQELNWKTDLIQ